MKRTQRCFDLTSLEQDRSMREDLKRCRTDSEQSDMSLESELSEMSGKFETCTSITPTASPDVDSVTLNSIKFHFSFQPEDFVKRSCVEGKTGLDRAIHISLMEDQ